MSTNQNNSDNKFMRLAFKKASEHLGSTKENPSVGCIIVKSGSIVSSGVTSIKGRPHAEKIALSSKKRSLIYRSENRADITMASSVILALW